MCDYRCAGFWPPSRMDHPSWVPSMIAHRSPVKHERLAKQTYRKP